MAGREVCHGHWFLGSALFTVCVCVCARWGVELGWWTSDCWGADKEGEPPSPPWDGSAETLSCDAGGRAASCHFWRGQPRLGGLGGGSGGCSQSVSEVALFLLVEEGAQPGPSGSQAGEATGQRHLADSRGRLAAGAVFLVFKASVFSPRP